MNERNSGIHIRRAWPATPFLLCLLTVLGVFAAVRPAQAQPCGMVATSTGDEFWPCPNQPSRTQSPPEPDVWGAIAVSPTTLVWGTSWNYKSKEEAAAMALKQCQSTTGVKDCKVALKVADVCTALVLSRAEKLYVIGGPAGALNFATANGMLKCQRAGGRTCAIATSFCADGDNHVLKGNSIISNGNPIFVPPGQSTALRH